MSALLTRIDRAVVSVGALLVHVTGDLSHGDEYARCAASPQYFIQKWILIYDAATTEWIPFRLWPAQVDALTLVHAESQVVILKARQLGLTWLLLAYALWTVLFRPIATVLVFSLRETEAIYLLGDERLRGMWERLPPFLRGEMTTDSARLLVFGNGSTVRAFPTSAGDSYTATLALVDEADLVPDLGRLLRRVKPTVEAGGKLVLLSRSNKSEPQSEFKRVYLGAVEGKTGWRAIFLPWHVRPIRDAAWYERQRTEILARTGALDELHEQYPGSQEDALAQATLDKRIPAAWLAICYEPRPAIDAPGAPALPELRVYIAPVPGRRYAVGADPAEGLQGGDDSSAHVLDRETGEEVAILCGKLEPKRAFPGALAKLARWYNGAEVLVERISHGHSVIAGLEAEGGITLLNGRDGRPGWVESLLGKVLLYDHAADAIRNGECRIHSLSTWAQLGAVNRNTLSAPKGEHDDQAISFALALMARTIEPSPVTPFAPAAGIQAALRKALTR